MDTEKFIVRLTDEERQKLETIVTKLMALFPFRVQVGAVPVAKRWVVERTFAWVGHNCRLSKDYERTITGKSRTHCTSSKTAGGTRIDIRLVPQP